jgi:hypothetical protein
MVGFAQLKNSPQIDMPLFSETLSCLEPITSIFTEMWILYRRMDEMHSNIYHSRDI